METTQSWVVFCLTNNLFLRSIHQNRTIMNQRITIELLAPSNVPQTVGRLTQQKLADFLEKNVPPYMNPIDIILIPCEIKSVEKPISTQQQQIQIRLIVDTDIPAGTTRQLVSLIKKNYKNWNEIPVITSISAY